MCLKYLQSHDESLLEYDQILKIGLLQNGQGTSDEAAHQ